MARKSQQGDASRTRPMWVRRRTAAVIERAASVACGRGQHGPSNKSWTRGGKLRFWTTRSVAPPRTVSRHFGHPRRALKLALSRFRKPPDPTIHEF